MLSINQHKNERNKKIYYNNTIYFESKVKRSIFKLNINKIVQKLNNTQHKLEENSNQHREQVSRSRSETANYTTSALSNTSTLYGPITTSK